MKDVIENILYLFDSMPDDVRTFLLEEYSQLCSAIEELREYQK